MALLSRLMMTLLVVMMIMVMLDLMRKRILHGEQAWFFHKFIPRNRIQKFYVKQLISKQFKGNF